MFVVLHASIGVGCCLLFLSPQGPSEQGFCIGGSDLPRLRKSAPVIYHSIFLRLVLHNFFYVFCINVINFGIHLYFCLLLIVPLRG